MRRAHWLVLAGVLGAGAPAAAYVRSRSESGAPLAWGRRCIPFWINERGSEDLGNFAVAEDATRKSFETWENVACSDLEFPYQGRTDIDDVGIDFRNVILWRDAPGSWDHPRGVIALTTTTFCTKADGGQCDVAGRILDADIEMNGVDYDFTHTSNPLRTRFDARNTLTHEIGHFVGLDHTPVPEATMYDEAPRGETAKATLHPDDITGMCDVYPSVESPGACEPIPDPSDVPGGGGGGEGGCDATGGAGPFPWLALALLWRRRRLSGGAGRAG
jgi:uncharacterized protein (TIGR03382 family)